MSLFQYFSFILALSTYIVANMYMPHTPLFFFTCKCGNQSFDNHHMEDRNSPFFFFAHVFLNQKKSAHFLLKIIIHISNYINASRFCLKCLKKVSASCWSTVYHLHSTIHSLAAVLWQNTHAPGNFRLKTAIDMSVKAGILKLDFSK